jgi:hypothetical protein
MKLIQHLLWVIIGYAVAVLVASLMTVTLVMAFQILPNGGQPGAFHTIVKDAAVLVYVGTLITAVYAFPWWLISVIIAFWKSVTRVRYFTVAGALTAFLAHMLMMTMDGITAPGAIPTFGNNTVHIIMASIVGGLVGGWAYWRVAVVRFGKWRVS